MDIGSCKPVKSELERVKHYLIDIVDPDFQFTAGEFCTRAEAACRDIGEKGKVPLVVGGTGLYIKSFYYGISEIPDLNSGLKKALADEADSNGLDSLFKELAVADPEYAGKIHPNDRQRIIRGLEVFRGTGRPFSAFHSESKSEKLSESLIFGLYIEKDILNNRIEARVDDMIQNGLVDEVRNLRDMGYSAELNSMKSIGYSEINEYLDDKIGFEEAAEKIKINTKKYAKKQMTWFKGMKDVIWLEAYNTNIIKEKIKNWLNQ